jgi:hypothetical protein
MAGPPPDLSQVICIMEEIGNRGGQRRGHHAFFYTNECSFHSGGKQARPGDPGATGKAAATSATCGLAWSFIYARDATRAASTAMASWIWRTAASMAMSELSLLTAEPTPTPDAPAASASGAVIAEMPDAAIVGMPTAREMAASPRLKRQKLFWALSHPYTTAKEPTGVEAKNASGVRNHCVRWVLPAVAARVGAAFSIRPWIPAAEGFMGMPPSVWMTSAPARSSSIARATWHREI